MRGISWLAAKTGQLLKKDSAPWSKKVSTKAFERYLPKLFYSKGEGKRNDEGWLNIKRRV
jgi:hypothetical protein